MTNTTAEKINTEKFTQVTEMNNTANIENKTHVAEAIMENANDLHETEEERKLLVARNKVAARTAIKRSNQPNLADGIVGPGTANMSPGAMQMSAVVKFHSTQSINMFRGRKGDPEKGIRPIIGLARFARQVSLVWSAAAIDDPYADQVLLDIEQAYDAAKMSLEAKEKTMTNLLEGLDDFEVTLQASVQPVQITLQFYSPWGFRGAMLLKQFDKLIRMALTARHIGIFTEEDWVSIVRDAARSLRHMFNEVDGWVSTGVKREDIRNSTNVAKRAAARYEEIKKGYLVVDQEVISGLYRAKLSPVNRILEKYLSELVIEQLVPHEKKQATTGMVVINEAEKTKSKSAPNFGFNTINRNNTQIATSTTTEAVINSRDKVNAHTAESKSTKGDA